ncbi:hypothetical protein [Leucobacter komagatae]|uniref:hypothetical protein n=1 Tax=Leucobacter komagatae TaxID=55969 RepID=UPI000696D519|nr:hypothetical protein [Leucobacter komagatae]
MQIRSLEPKRLREAAKVLAEAFTDEPVIAQMLPLGTMHRQRKIADYFVWSMRLSGLDTVDVAVDPDTDKIVGVARWKRPGRVSRWYTGLPATPGVLRGVGRRGLRALDAYEAAGEGKHPAEPHWHLVDIGTCLAARGHGVGTASSNTAWLQSTQRVALPHSKQRPPATLGCTKGSASLTSTNSTAQRLACA